MKRTLCIMAACALCIPSAAYISACSPQEEERSIYTITAAYDGADTLTGSVELNYLNDTENALDCLKFNLWGNAFREGAKHPAAEGLTSSSCGGMEMTEVRGGTWSVGGEDENILEVVLGEPLYPDMRVSVGIDFKLDLAQADARTGVTEHTVNLGNFYPVLCAYGESGWLEYTYSQTGDPFVSETADYAVELTIPQGYTAAASGAAAESMTDGENVTLSYRLENARDFAAVLSQQFSVAERDAGGVAVKYYYYDDSEPQTVLDAAAESLNYFSEKFGKYPYSSFSVVQTGLTQGGMEYPALAMISDECRGTDAVYTAVHETAHQWWYAAVGSNQYTAAWQDEGLAEYSALMFFEDNTRYGFTRAGLTGSATKSYRAYFSVYNQLFADADTSMSRTLDEFSGEYEYANIAYNKALLMFDAVRAACGDDNFESALRRYCADYKFELAPPEGLTAAFAGYAGCEAIIRSFIDGEVII